MITAQQYELLISDLESIPPTVLSWPGNWWDIQELCPILHLYWRASGKPFNEVTTDIISYLVLFPTSNSVPKFLIPIVSSRYGLNKDQIEEITKEYDNGKDRTDGLQRVVNYTRSLCLTVQS